ncbi:GGIII-like transmembrane region-containing protein [Paenibacillus tengchongensis]|uniref:GGIII-like transmembrane region-containing protein n=1 Tax=Paenibacillus tengchongensis TaxID=2608684 RepID=UPI00124D16EA|nr:GGIII-like transmembrane region-containing protein [Paenibacillus tengchongensis]
MRAARAVVAALLMIVMLALAGCAQSTAHVTVKKNGSLEFAFSLVLNARLEALAGSKLEEVLSEKLEPEGIVLQKSKNGDDTEYLFRKVYASYKDLPAMNTAGNLDIIDAEVNQEDKWLYTKYSIVAQPKFSSYTDDILNSLGDAGVPQPLVRLLLQSFAIDFKLTLPFDLYGENNAVSQDGNTLTWHLTLTDEQPLELTLMVPNVRNIAIAGGGALLVIIAAVVLFIRSRKRRKPKAV